MNKGCRRLSQHRAHISRHCIHHSASKPCAGQFQSRLCDSDRGSSAPANPPTFPFPRQPQGLQGGLYLGKNHAALSAAQPGIHVLKKHSAVFRTGNGAAPREDGNLPLPFPHCDGGRTQILLCPGSGIRDDEHSRPLRALSAGGKRKHAAAQCPAFQPMPVPARTSVGTRNSGSGALVSLAGRKTGGD